MEVKTNFVQEMKEMGIFQFQQVSMQEKRQIFLLCILIDWDSTKNKKETKDPSLGVQEVVPWELSNQSLEKRE